jgi:hypothetical protein
MHFSPIVAEPSAAPHTFCLDITIFKSWNNGSEQWVQFNRHSCYKFLKALNFLTAIFPIFLFLSVHPGSSSTGEKYYFGQENWFSVWLCLEFKVWLCCCHLQCFYMIWIYQPGPSLFLVLLKGTVSKDFLLLVFFRNQFPPSPWLYHMSRESGEEKPGAPT